MPWISADGTPSAYKWLEDLANRSGSAVVSATSAVVATGTGAHYGSGVISSESIFTVTGVASGPARGEGVITSDSFMSGSYAPGHLSTGTITSSSVLSATYSVTLGGYSTGTGSLNVPVTASATGDTELHPTSDSYNVPVSLTTKKNSVYALWDKNSPRYQQLGRYESESCEVRLYEEDGKTLVCILDKARNVQWQDELSDIGSASFELPLYDEKTALVEQGMVVKFSWRGRERFGCFVAKESVELCKDEYLNLWLKFDSQPGCASIFKRAVTFPEWNVSPEGDKIENSTRRGVMHKTRTTDRWFGFMSWRGEWLVESDWHIPVGVKFTADSTTHTPWCPGWWQVDKNAYWIDLSPGPQAASIRPPGEVHYFRGVFTLSANMVAQFWATADNICAIYLDNELLFEEDRKSIYQWTVGKMKPVELLKGTHLIAVRVENATNLESVGPMALIASIILLNSTTQQPGENYVYAEEGTSTFFTEPDGVEVSANGIRFLQSMAVRVRGLAPNITIDVYSNLADTQSLTDSRALALKNQLLSLIPGAHIFYEGHSNLNPKYSPSSDPLNSRVLFYYPTYVEGEDPTTPIDDITTKSIFHTAPTDNWTVTNTAPGWFRASVVKKLIEEAWDRGVYGFVVPSPSYLMSFNDYVDSDNKPWMNRGQFSFPIGTSLYDVMMDLSEDHLDWHWDAADWELDCWNRAGRDKCAEIRLFPGYSLNSLETTSDPGEKFTWVTGRLSSGEWISRPAYGTPISKRIETSISLGSTDAESTALESMDAVIDEYESPVESFVAEVSSAEGPQPYVDYELGDTILIPGHRGIGVVPARIISITADFSGDVPKLDPELVLDRSSAHIDEAKYEISSDAPRRLPRTKSQRLEQMTSRFLLGSAQGRSQYASPVNDLKTTETEPPPMIYFTEDTPYAKVGDFWIKPSDIPTGA